MTDPSIAGLTEEYTKDGNVNYVDRRNIGPRAPAGNPGRTEMEAEAVKAVEAAEAAEAEAKAKAEAAKAKAAEKATGDTTSGKDRHYQQHRGRQGYHQQLDREDCQLNRHLEKSVRDTKPTGFYAGSGHRKSHQQKK